MLLVAEGFQIDTYYDQETLLNGAFLAPFNAIIFGLHQKTWSSTGRADLDAWIRLGGGMFIYSDSASGGLHSLVGLQNTVGQGVVNALISPYGLEVCVDQSNGIQAYRAGPAATHPVVAGRPVLEGEGVSPVAIDIATGATVLIPFSDHPDNYIRGVTEVPHQQNLTITNAVFAALAMTQVGDGKIVVMFDR
ncbi:MAG: hypothetical protein OSB41_09195 [Kiritimatiellae bacterium]|nr:hypothetical protein [Kiritimatiellia bacterium]